MATCFRRDKNRRWKVDRLKTEGKEEEERGAQIGKIKRNGENAAQQRRD